MVRSLNLTNKNLSFESSKLFYGKLLMGPLIVEISQRLTALQDECNTQKEELDEDLKRTSACVAEAYDK